MAISIGCKEIKDDNGNDSLCEIKNVQSLANKIFKAFFSVGRENILVSSEILFWFAVGYWKKPDRSPSKR
jgi:hypothetical protein